MRDLWYMCYIYNALFLIQYLFIKTLRHACLKDIQKSLRFWLRSILDVTNEAFFDWSICKILFSDWLIRCFETFVALSGPHLLSRDVFYKGNITFAKNLRRLSDIFFMLFIRSVIYRVIIVLLILIIKIMKNYIYIYIYTRNYWNLIWNTEI